MTLASRGRKEEGVLGGIGGVAGVLGGVGGFLGIDVAMSCSAGRSCRSQVLPVFSQCRHRASVSPAPLLGGGQLGLLLY